MRDKSKILNTTLLALEVVPWKPTELDTLLARDDCSEARSIAALFMVREKLHARR